MRARADVLSGMARAHVKIPAFVLLSALVFVAGCGRFAERSRQRNDRRETACAPAPAPSIRAVPQPPNGYVAVTVASIQAQGDDAVVELLSPSREVVRVYVGGTEGQSLRLRSAHRTPPRPLTHDLLDSVLRELHAEVVQAQVDELKGGVFFGTLVVRHDGKDISIDARPSDAIALAVGAKAPIFMAKSVIRDAAPARDDEADSHGL